MSVSGEMTPVHEVATWPLVRLHLCEAETLTLTCFANVCEGEGLGAVHGDERAAQSRSSTPVRGQSIWSVCSQDRALVGVAFEWVEIMPEVFALADPRGLASNILIFDNGRPVPDETHNAALMSMLSRIEWQRHVAHHKGNCTGDFFRVH